MEIMNIRWLVLFLLAPVFFSTCSKEGIVEEIPEEPVDPRKEFIGIYSVSATSYRWEAWTEFDFKYWDTLLTVKKVSSTDDLIQIYGKEFKPRPNYEGDGTCYIEEPFYEDGYVWFFEPDSIYYTYETGGIMIRKYYIFEGKKL